MIGLITEWKNKKGVEKRSAESDLGGTMRLGGAALPHQGGTLARASTAPKSMSVTATGTR